MAAYMDMPTAKAVLINALPAMAALCMAMIYSLADMFFIGKTNDPYQVAAIALASPVFMICVSFGTIFGIGGTSVISRALGEGRKDYTKKVSYFCMYGGMHFGTKTLEYYRVVVVNAQIEENITIHLNTTVKEAGKDHVLIEHDGKQETLNVDSIAVCVGMKARTDEAMKFWRPSKRTDIIGDCKKAEDIEHAIRTAYDAAINIGR